MLARLLPWLVHNPSRRYDLGADVVIALLRFLFGLQFAQSGWGKLQNIQQVADWFGNDLGIPMPLANAYMAAGTELVGGSLLLIGLASRLISVPLTVVMCVAFATSDKESLVSIDEFTSATPFPFLVTTLLVLAYGPGWFSLDGLIAYLRGQRQ
jgi:putative oxidoreductase